MIPQEDPFAEFRINKQKSPEPKMQSQPSQDHSQQTEDQFSEFRIKKVEGFPFLREGGRHVARTASRIAETIGGIPGDIQDLIQSGVFAGLEMIGGHKVSEDTREKARKQRAPTSRELKELSEKVTGGFTSPESNIEKSIDEYVETAASLFGPMKFRKSLGVALAASGAKEALKISGVSEGPQEAAKLGTMFLTTMINPGGALKYATTQYDKAKNIAKGASIKADRFKNNLKTLESGLKEGFTTSSKNAVLKPTEELLTKIENGKIPVTELMAAKRDVNTVMKDPSLLKREKKLLLKLGKEIDIAIKPYEKINTEFSKSYRPANEIYGAVMQGTKASDFIKKTLGGKPLMAAAGAAAGEFLAGYPEAILPTLATGGILFAGAKGTDFLTRMAKSRELQKYYSKAMAAALAEDAPTLRLYSDKIEEFLEER